MAFSWRCLFTRKVDTLEVLELARNYVGGIRDSDEVFIHNSTPRTFPMRPEGVCGIRSLSVSINEGRSRRVARKPEFRITLGGNEYIRSLDRGQMHTPIRRDYRSVSALVQLPSRACSNQTNGQLGLSISMFAKPASINEVVVLQT